MDGSLSYQVLSCDCWFMMLLHYIVILFTNDRTIIPKMVIYQILINSNTNNVWEVLAGVTYT